MTHWITFRGKEIFYVDYQGLKGQALIDNMEQAFQIIGQSQTKLLILANYTGVKVDTHFMARVKEAGKKTTNQIERQAIVASDALVNIFLNAYNAFTKQDTRAFSTEQEAQEWLVS